MIESKLNEIFDLSKINFDECTQFAFNNLMYLVCNTYKTDKKITVAQLADKFNISKDSVRRYLKAGNDGNLCIYNTEESKERTHNFRKEQYMNSNEINFENGIICVETNQFYKSISYASKILGVHTNAISRCVKNKNFTCKGYHWIKYSELDKSLFNNINFNIVIQENISMAISLLSNLMINMKQPTTVRDQFSTVEDMKYFSAVIA